MNDFTRADLVKPAKTVKVVLDFVDDYIEYCGRPAHTLHLHRRHWDFVNNALTRNTEMGVTLLTATYRGVTLLPA